jgi:hypothetical protein
MKSLLTVRQYVAHEMRRQSSFELTLQSDPILPGFVRDWIGNFGAHASETPDRGPGEQKQP